MVGQISAFHAVCDKCFIKPQIKMKFFMIPSQTPIKYHNSLINHMSNILVGDSTVLLFILPG